MKKLFFYTLSIAFCTLVITSCKKPTKAKIVNKWSVRLYQETSPYETYTLSDDYFDPNKFTIKGNGTWIWARKRTTYGSLFGGSVNVKNEIITKEEGTWKLAKSEGHKDKRLTFNTLSETQYVKQTYSSSNEPPPNYTESAPTIYAEGEKTITYTILESTGKILKLKTEISQLNPLDGTTFLKTIVLNLEEDK